MVGPAEKAAFVQLTLLIPWDEWVDLIKPHYFSGKRGRPPKGIEKMLRMYLLQCWFTLWDKGVEDSIYDSYAFCKFSSSAKARICSGAWRVVVSHSLNEGEHDRLFAVPETNN